MATSQLPAVIDALVSLARAALPGLGDNVSDGWNVSEDPGDYVMVGVDSPADGSAASVGGGSQVPMTMGTDRPRDEEVSINISAESWNGDADQKLARDTAFSYVAAFETFLRADPTLGFTTLRSMVAQFGGIEALYQDQDQYGAQAQVIFTVTYKARI